MRIIAETRIPVKIKFSLKILLVIIIAILFISIFYTGNVFADYTVKEKKDIPYVTGSKSHPEKHKLNVFYPEGKKNCPVYMFIHGGGWKKGDRKLYDKLGKTFARKGIVAVIISYRLSPDYRHPAHVQDAASAFAWTYKNIKKYSGDPGNIFVSGHSAGGHISALLALDGQYLKAHGLSPKNIRGVIPISGLYKIAFPTPGKGISRRDKKLMPVFGKDQSKWDSASPITYVRKDVPPFLILTGEKEPRFVIYQAKLFCNALKRKGANVWKKEIPGKNHITEIRSIGRSGDKTSPIVIKFINEESKN
ncbi:MAG: alpha/beta hydrolase [Candidatus Eremiobacteraeota bacterium]|nr:alpha/beta hydrolase [Candidatus Eremiobacteraeota bacterium]